MEYLSYLKFVIDKILEYHVSSVLDVGCGDGRFLNILNEIGNFNKIKGIDLSARAVKLAQALNYGIEFDVKDIKDETGTYEAVVCIEVLEHIPEEELTGFLSGICNTLCKDGRVFITVPSVNLPLNKKHYRHYTVQLLEKQLQDSGLKLEEYFYIVPLSTTWDKIAQKLLNNHFYEMKIYDNWCWKRLWRKKLIATADNSSHIFAILRVE